jgi:lipid II:glycine glycyltransferase (peptidoglycan interpeptide bridge formation enzyme)
MIRREICSPENWSELMNQQFSCHILQTTQWAAFKAITDWKATYIIWRNEDNELLGGASILCRTSIIPVLKIPIRILYTPRGPVLNWLRLDTSEEILDDLVQFAKEQNAVYVKIDPEVIFDVDGPQQFNFPLMGDKVQSILQKQNWIFAKEQIQFKNTFWLSLLGSDEQLLANMKQKTRYNVRLAEKKGVIVREATPDDFHLLYEMYAETSARDGFVIRNEDYYTDLWQRLYQDQMAYGLIAEYDNEPLAGLMNFVQKERAWYFYGMSTIKHRNLMPTYLLQWEAIKKAKTLGCSIYDLWGAPDEIDENDAMFGVFRFKQGLGASFIKGIGAWDYVIQSFWYQMISILLPRILDIMRIMRTKELKKEVYES